MRVTWSTPPRKDAERITAGLDSQRLREEVRGELVVNAGARTDPVLRSCGVSAYSQPNVGCFLFKSPKP